MKNKLVLAGVVVLAVLFVLSYLGSTKVYTVTYTVKGSDITDEQRQAKLAKLNEAVTRDNDFAAYESKTSREMGESDPGIATRPSVTSLPPETAELTIQNASGGSEQMSVVLPWTMTMQKHSGDFLYLSAQADKGTPSVDVAILSDGVLVQHAASSGEYTIATASGKVQ